MIDELYSNRTTVNLLAKVLDISSKRQQVLSSNIANDMTPGYVKKDVRFEETLAQASSKPSIGMLIGDERHIPPSADQTEKPVVLANEPGRDLEKDMAVSAENQLLYTTVVQIVAKQFQGLKLAIKGSG
jgi:flagellar basal-body rod protein FlgB